MSRAGPVWEQGDPVEVRRALSELVAARNSLFRLFREAEVPHLVEWMFTHRAWSPEPVLVRMLREWGRPLDADERARLAFPADHPVVGDLFALRLTAEGRADPSMAAAALLHWPAHELAQQTMRGQLLEAADWGIYRVTRETCCRAALHLADGVCFSHEVVSFPRPGCSRPKCNCTVERYSPRQHGPITRDLRDPVLAAQADRAYRAEVDVAVDTAGDLVAASHAAIQAATRPRDLAIMLLAGAVVLLALAWLAK